MKKILILEANPHQYLFLDKEIRELRRVIDEASDRTKFRIKDGAAARKDKLHELLLALEDKEPKDESIIVHFCGHGTGEKGLVFEDHKGESDLVGTKTLADFFELFKDKVACVVMNACYSEKQAKAINEHIKYVIGMNQAIRDDTAIAFSIGFYRALGYDKSIEDAFRFGKNAIQLIIDDGLKNQDAIAKEMRKLIAVGDVSEANIIPEHLIPILAINQNLMIPNSIPPKPQAKINERNIERLKREEKLERERDPLEIALLNLDYKKQVRTFEDFWDIDDCPKIGCFLIQGKIKYGQEWLVHKLINHHFPDPSDARKITINLPSHVESDIEELWLQFSRSLNLKYSAPPSDLVQYVHELWKKNTVILIFRNLDRIYNQEIQQLIEDFLIPLAKIKNQNSYYYYLSIFLVDNRNKAYKWNINSIQDLQYWQPYKIIKLPDISILTEDLVAKWLRKNHKRLHCFCQTKELIPEVASNIFEQSLNGIPEIMIEEIRKMYTQNLLL